MATISTYIYKYKQKKDGTWRVYIRLTHNRVARYIPTEMYVTKKDLSSSFQIKNRIIVEKCNDLMRVYRDRLHNLDLELNDIHIDDIVAQITHKEYTEELSFTEWADEFIEKKMKTSVQSANNYRTALRALSSFLKKDVVMMRDVNTRNMTRFAESFSDRPRAASLYSTAIAKMFNDAREFYNDEDTGVIVIKHSLRKFKIPKQNVAHKRALTVEQVRAIFALPYDGKVNKQGGPSLHDLALDCFKLSFCLMGMNSADLYNAKEFDGETIVYQRTKTKARRSDGAEMHVKVHPYIAPLVEKYRGEKAVFNFCERYADLRSLNKYINRGLKSIGAELGIEGLQFYAARHSMATIAANDCAINLWTVNLMLCHTAPSMKMTELYIKKDYSQENQAMAKVIEYVIGE